MRAHRLTSRCTTWVFALALLLKAAVPMLATSAAQWQGKALAEVCTVYGVAMVAVDATGSSPGHEGGVAHAAEHCTLSGWVALSSPGVPPAAVPAGAVTTLTRSEAAFRLRHDAYAAWAAQLQHGPPRLA